MLQDNKLVAKTIALASIIYGISWIYFFSLVFKARDFLENFINLYYQGKNPFVNFQNKLQSTDLFWLFIGIAWIIAGVLILRKNKNSTKLLLSVSAITLVIVYIIMNTISAVIVGIFSITIVALVISYQKSFAIHSENLLVNESVSLRLRKIVKWVGVFAACLLVLMGVAQYFLTKSGNASSFFSVTNPVYTFKASDGTEYKGEAKDNKPHGKGTLIKPNGEKYVGEFIEGLANGSGIATFPNGDKYEGNFSAGVPNGKGTCFKINVGNFPCTFDHGKLLENKI